MIKKHYQALIFAIWVLSPTVEIWLNYSIKNIHGYSFKIFMIIIHLGVSNKKLWLSLYALLNWNQTADTEVWFAYSSLSICCCLIFKALIVVMICPTESTLKFKFSFTYFGRLSNCRFNRLDDWSSPCSWSNRVFSTRLGNSIRPFSYPN